MNSVQENKNELEAAVRYCESAITRAKQTIESMETPSARRLLAKWWEVKSMFEDQERVFALREAILRYRSVGCPNRARDLSKRMHQL